jgi:hypothetical protein
MLMSEENNKKKGYCEYCYLFHQCPWFCNKEIDKDNNPMEECWVREYTTEYINEKK